MDPCIVNIFQYISNKTQRYTVYLNLENIPYVSNGTSTHRQERINCIYSIWYVTSLLLPAAITVWQIPDAVNTVVCDPNYGWRYHPKHVEQFPDINKLCKVASCWIYIGIYLLLMLFPLASLFVKNFSAPCFQHTLCSTLKMRSL
jgi:hypothetical protein